MLGQEKLGQEMDGGNDRSFENNFTSGTPASIELTPNRKKLKTEELKVTGVQSSEIVLEMTEGGFVGGEQMMTEDDLVQADPEEALGMSDAELLVMTEQNLVNLNQQVQSINENSMLNKRTPQSAAGQGEYADENNFVGQQQDQNQDFVYYT